jgi:hypothetical protein
MKTNFRNVLNKYIVITKPNGYQFLDCLGDVCSVKKSNQSETVAIKNLKTGDIRYIHFDNAVICKIVTPKENPEYFL